jgi:cell division control protein 6
MKSGVFRDETILYPEYIPKETPHRDKHLKLLELYFQDVLENPLKVSQNVMLYGPVGSGKTMLARKLADIIEKKSVLYGCFIKFLHVNCRIDKTIQSIFVRALGYIGQNYPSRGYGFEELLHALVSELTSKRMHLIIVFDEVDSLIYSEPSSLYTITRLREVTKGYQVFSSLLISKTLDYVKAVDLSTISSLQWNTVCLEPYSSEQLFDILLSRSIEAFNEGCIDEECIQLVADIASVYGDARYALDIIYRAGKLAEASGSGKVFPEHIRQARASLPPQLRKEELSYLTKHQKFLLMAISGLLKNSSSAYVTIGEVEKSYSALCESFGVTPNHHTQVWNDVTELSRKGIIETQLSGKGMRGRTTLIGLSIVPAKELIEELERGIVADVRG